MKAPSTGGPPTVVHLSLGEAGQFCLAFFMAGRSLKDSVVGTLQGGHRPAVAGAQPHHIFGALLCLRWSPSWLLNPEQRQREAVITASPGSCLPSLCTVSSPHNTLHSPVPALSLCLQLLLPTVNDLHQGCQAVPSISRRIQSL